MEQPKMYAGVGSQIIPYEMELFIPHIAKWLADDGYVLSTGDAKGAEEAFRRGAGGYVQMHYAWNAYGEPVRQARLYHPAWDMLKVYGKRLHGRNVCQVLGEDCASPVEFVICWTPDGARTHAERSIQTQEAATAISVADAHGIPVWNLQQESDRAYWKTLTGFEGWYV